MSRHKYLWKPAYPFRYTKQDEMEMAKRMAEVNEVAALYESRFKPKKLKFLEEVSCSIAVADPGFPVGVAPSRWGGADLRCGHFLTKNVCENERIGSCWGGMHRWRPPGSANGIVWWNRFFVVSLN